MPSHRARRILLAAVGEFIATGEPVASRSLAGREGMGLSPASVRAVLAELEAEGYLVKPHASAGRVPTEKGFRAFADAVVAAANQLTPPTDELDRRYSDAEPGIEGLMRRAVKVLADMSGAASLVRTPRADAWVLRELRFVWLRPREVLAVVVAAHGAVQNRVMRLDDTPSPLEIERMNNLLQERIEGRTLAEVRARIAAELESDRVAQSQLQRRALELGREALTHAGSEGEVLVEGAARLLERPEFADVDKTRQVVRTLDDRQRLLDLLDRTIEAPGIQVVIGSADNDVGHDLSLVAARFGSGAVGVLGSTRMDYAQVVPLVRHTAMRLTRALGRG
jgi:heat-inducible transcriptional repressor